MARFEDLPSEVEFESFIDSSTDSCYDKVVEHILGFLDDPVTVVRSGSVNQLWNTIVKCLVRRGRLKYIHKTLRRLKTTESFNESSSIKEAKMHAFKVFNFEASA